MRSLRGLTHWLYPGMRVKRWLAVMVVGITILSLGFAYVLRTFYPLPAIFYYLTLQFIPRLLRGLLFGVLGVAAVVAGLYGLNRSLLAAVAPPGGEGVMQTLYRQRAARRGPRVVVIGGGKGLSIVLRGLKEYTPNLTAILTLTDEALSPQGSAPGIPDDFRGALVALADAEPLVTQLFAHHFPAGNSLNGRTFGNLFLKAMEAVTGDFERALEESSRVLAVRGQILPSTLETVRLSWEDGMEAEGEAGDEVSLRMLSLEPPVPAAYPKALEAIRKADLIILGPGSLYRRVLPGLLIGELAEAIRASQGLRVFVCNLATEAGETEGCTVSSHVRALHRHLGGGLVDVVLANRQAPDGTLADGATPVAIDARLVEGTAVRVVEADILDPEHPTQHHPQKLAKALISLLPR